MPIVTVQGVGMLRFRDGEQNVRVLQRFFGICPQKVTFSVLPLAFSL